MQMTTPTIPISKAVEMAAADANRAKLPQSLHRVDDPDQQWTWGAEVMDPKPREAVAVVLPRCWWGTLAD